MILALDKENKEENLKKLKNFYENSWCNPEISEKQSYYIENDIALYELFNKKDEICEQCKNINSKYSTRISNKDIKIISGIIKKYIEDELDLNPESFLEKFKENGGLKNYKSFISKYCHWYYEVKNYGQIHFPIYDKYVRFGLIYYNVSYLCVEDFNKLKNLIDKFIEDYLPNKGYERIEIKLNKLKQNDFPEKISIYRLVDKFLWLQYKIAKEIDLFSD